MTKVRLTKKYTFEMAHALKGYDGLCRHIHGHSYTLEITVIGTPMSDDSHPKNGMVMDFKELKKIVKSQIVEKFDHALVMSAKSNPQLIEVLKEDGHKLILTDYQPTCELMLLDYVHTVRAQLPDHVQLFSMRLHETQSSFAEWFASDND
ncbi:MAG: 6-carboxytetrahydropterin synthase [Saprospiraceae bacterium]|nr:6-carboxytetrahydropterin synthase [Saprospiraceae bacterium]